MNTRDLELLTDEAGRADMEVRQYHASRGEYRADDVVISRPAGIVSARESNDRELATFRGQELMRRSRTR